MKIESLMATSHDDPAPGGSERPAHRLARALIARSQVVGDRLLSSVRASRRGSDPPAPAVLRLLHCCGQFAINQGGTERQARAVARALAARGHQVSVLTRRTPGAGQVVAGVTVHARIRAVQRGRLFGISYVGSAASHLIHLARGADVLHAHQLYLDAVAALVAGRILRRPVVAKMVGGGPGGDLDRLRGTAGGALFLRLLRTLDAVVAPSPACRGELLTAGFPMEQIRIIPNGVDTAAFHPEPVADSPTPHGIRGSPVVVFTGRLVAAKGLLDLLEAWLLVLRQHPDARLVLVGSGPLEPELHRRAARPDLADRVHLVGEVLDVRPYLRSATAFVFPSWAEGLPNALLEAMAMGLPCVATDIGGISDAVTGGEEALLVPARAPRELAAAVGAILAQPALAARLGRAARKRVEAAFSLEIAVDRLETLYREICAGRSRGDRRG